jgi:hypothetical protein
VGRKFTFPILFSIPDYYRSTSKFLNVWRGTMECTKFGDKRVNVLGLLSGLCSWSCIFAPRECIQADLHAGPFPYVLIICSLPVCHFCLQCCSSSFSFIFICTNPKQTLLMSARSTTLSSTELHSSTSESEARDSLHSSSCQNRRSYTAFSASC